jgi:hypothetical protein
MRNRRTALVFLAVVCFALRAPAFAQSPDPVLEELKRQVLQAQDTLQKQQAVIEALQRRIAELEKANASAVTKEELKSQLAVESKKSPSELPEGLKGPRIGTQIFFSYQNANAWSGIKDESSSYSAFAVKRAYLDVNWDVNAWMSARVTPDIYGTTLAGGQYVFRLKYAYANFHWKGNEFFNTPFVEAGIIHTPWIDYEEQINRYRCVEPTFLDRNGIYSSADIGVETGSNIGPELSAEFRTDTSNRYAGRWGSWALGFYNGGGYTTGEKNMNKAFGWRLSIRPFGESVPALTGLQLQWSGIQGKGNVAPDGSRTPVIPPPELAANYYGLTYQSKYVNAEAMWYKGRGNLAGTAVDPQREQKPALPMKGYTYFIEGRFPADRRWGTFFRYDRFDPNTDRHHRYGRDIQVYEDVGVAFWMFKANALVLDYAIVQHAKPWTGQPSGQHEGIPDDHRWQLTLQVKF